MRAYVLILLAVLLCGVTFAADLFDTKVTFYSTDTKAFITDSSYAKIADIELKNAVTKSGGQLWLQDCDIFTCSLYVDFTPTEEYTIDEKDFGGVVVGSDRVHYSMASLYEEHVVERTRATYTEKPKTVELCTTDNATLKTTCKNETQTEMVQTGVETYEETVSGYEEAKDGTVLKAGEKYRFRFDFTRDKSNEVADLQPKLFNTVEGWAWWNSTWNSYREQNITCSNCDGSAQSFNTTFPIAVNGEIRFTTNSTGTETACGGAWNYNETSTTQFILNCTLLNGTTAIRGYYNNLSTVSDIRNIGLGCTFGDTFTSDTNWDNFTFASPTAGATVFSGGLVNITSAKSSAVDSMRGIITKTNFTMKNKIFATETQITYPDTANYQSVYWFYLDRPMTTMNGASEHWYGVVHTTFTAATTDKLRMQKNPVFATLTNTKNYYEGATLIPFEIYEFIWRNSGDELAFYNSTSFLVANNETTFAQPQTWKLALGVYSYSHAAVSEMSSKWLCLYDDFSSYGYNATFSDWSGEINNTATATAPTNNLISLYPTTLYKNMTVACAVNWTDDGNDTFSVDKWISVNGTPVVAFTEQITNYTNASIWNTTYALTSYSHGDKISCGSNASDTSSPVASSGINYTANITMSNYIPVISNVQITSPLAANQNATGTATFTDYEGDTINCRWMWYRNGTSIYNDSQSPCTNTSTLDEGNYSATDLINFTVTANDSYDGVNSASSASATIEVQPDFTWNSETHTASQYEGVSYTYIVNYTLPPSTNLTYHHFYFYGANLTPSCSQTNQTYYCTASSIPAPPVAVNATAENAYWVVNYTDGIDTVKQTNPFTITIYYGAWPTAITSTEEVAMGSNVQVNLSYSNASGFGGAGASLSAIATLGSNAGALTCSNYVCTGNVIAPTVTTATIYQTGANYTLTSNFWGESVTRNVSFSQITGMENVTAYTYAGSISGYANYVDSDWATYATMPASSYYLLNYSLTKMANMTAWRTKDTQGTRDITIPQDCWGQTIQLKTFISGTYFNYSCYNYTSDAFVSLGAYLRVTYIRGYEENLTFTYNNSYTRVVPYGLQVCSGVGTTVFHYNAYDEGTLASLVVTYAQAFELDTGIAQSNHSTAGTDNSWDICYFPDSLTGNVSSFEEYSATGYADRNNFLNGVTLSGGPYTVPIYLLNSSDAKLTIVTVKENGLTVEGATVYVQRYYPANTTFTTVATLETDDSGKSLVYLNPNGAYYKFVVLVDGVIVHTSSSQQVICDPAESMCAVLLNIVPGGVDYWTYYDSISGACTKNLTAKTVSCVYASTSGVLSYARLIVTKTGVTATTTVCDVNSTTVSGTLFCNLGAGADGVYTYYLMAKYNPEYSLDSGSLDLGAINIFGGSGLLLTLLVFLTMAFIGIWSPPVGIIFGLVGLGASLAIGMVDISWAALAAIFVSGIILAIKMRS